MAVLSTVPTILTVGSAEIGRLFDLMLPVPFLTILASVTFAGAVGGRVPGLISGSIASLFVVHAGISGTELEKLHGSGDPEVAHGKADDLLLDFINDEAVREAWEEVPKWYA